MGYKCLYLSIFKFIEELSKFVFSDIDFYFVFFLNRV